MDRIAIVGVESVVGANLAAALSDSSRVYTLGATPDVSIAGCESVVCRLDDPESARRWTASVRPSAIVVCGPGSHSTWQQDDADYPQPGAINIPRTWARVAGEFGCRLTLISSDAVFTGPWMFHKEDSDGACPSDPAGILRQIEQDTWQLCPSALIVRTHAFGWTPQSLGTGWIERILCELEAETAGLCDYLRHATPILATDLAEILQQAWEAGLEGEYHIAGAERINPGRFVERLADEFNLPTPLAQSADNLDDLPAGFGRGECSLHTAKIRRALGIAMPTIAEGFSRLREQRDNGYRDRLCSATQPVHEKVA